MRQSLIQNQEMTLLPVGYVGSILANNVVLSGKISRVEDLTDFIIQTNGYLSKRECTKEVAIDVVASLAICVYANPILGLDLNDNKSVLNFSKLLSKKPYSTISPFDIRFESAYEHSNPSGELNVSELGGIVAVSHQLFNQRDSLKTELIMRKNNIACSILKNYSQMQHFMYSGLVNCCIPLFCETAPTSDDISSLEKLANDFGTFYQPFPKILLDKLPENKTS